MRKQFLVTIRIDAENSETPEYYFNEVDQGETTLDTQQLSQNNHEVIDWEEIP